MIWNRHFTWFVYKEELCQSVPVSFMGISISYFQHLECVLCLPSDLCCLCGEASLVWEAPWGHITCFLGLLRVSCFSIWEFDFNDFSMKPFGFTLDLSCELLTVVFLFPSLELESSWPLFFWRSPLHFVFFLSSCKAFIINTMFPLMVSHKFFFSFFVISLSFCSYWLPNSSSPSPPIFSFIKSVIEFPLWIFSSVVVFLNSKVSVWLFLLITLYR